MGLKDEIKNDLNNRKLSEIEENNSISRKREESVKTFTEDICNIISQGLKESKVYSYYYTPKVFGYKKNNGRCVYSHIELSFGYGMKETSKNTFSDYPYKFSFDLIAEEDIIKIIDNINTYFKENEILFYNLSRCSENEGRLYNPYGKSEERAPVVVKSADKILPDKRSVVKHSYTLSFVLMLD